MTVLTDTHCHLDVDAFDDDRNAVIARALSAGVTRIVVPSLNLDSSRSVVALAHAHECVYAAVGFHPTESNGWTSAAARELRERASDSRVVAIGEIGLDYFWDAAPRAVQRQTLREQLSLAGELSLPVIIHMRERGDAEGGPCADDLLTELGDWSRQLPIDERRTTGRIGVLHSFSGTAAAAAEAIRLGFYIGVTGPITYKNADGRRSVVGSLRPEDLLLETDAPYLAPVPHRGKRNEPAFLVHIADRIAEMFRASRDQIAQATSKNASVLFGWGDPD